MKVYNSQIETILTTFMTVALSQTTTHCKDKAKQFKTWMEFLIDRSDDDFGRKQHKIS